MRRVTRWSLAICLLLVTLVLWTRGAGISAVHARPWPFEAAVARTAWRFLIPAGIRHTTNPLTLTPEVLKAGRDHWADHCAACHANDGSGETPIGRRTYPRVPDMRVERTQGLTDGELFYAIEQGVPWTAMPGWSTGTPEGAAESWALVHFVRHLPSMAPDELREMEGRNPRPPIDERRQQAIEDFLNGGSAR